MGENTIEISGLSFRYGQREAVKNIDFQVEEGQIAVLAGPNGSGKTTLLKLLAGFLKPHQGRVSLFGLTPYRQRQELMKLARFAFAPPALYDALTAWEHMRNLTRLGLSSGMEPSDKTLMENLTLVGLESRINDPTRTFSFGMRQRLALALAITPTPRLLVLDEPSDGLDPPAVLELREILRRLRDERGVTVFLSSHLLVRLEELADRLLVLREGQTLFSGEPLSLIRDSARVHVRVAANSAAASTVFEEAGYPNKPSDVEVVFADRAPEFKEAVALLERKGLVPTAYWTPRPNLEDALLAKLAIGPKEKR